jgi:hypothetical protein
MSVLTIAGFEFRSRLKLISTWVYFLVFLSLALLWIAAAGGLFKEANISFGSGKVAVNSPYALAQTVAILGMFGITVMAAIMGRAVQQDVEYRTQSFFFTAPIGKLEYLGGRFLGALGVLLVVFASLGLGAFLATLLPGMDAERLGANRWAAYLSPYASVLLPNALVIGAVFFSLAAATKKMLPVYIGSVLVLIGWLIAQQLVRDADNRCLAALLDPFGSRALSVLTEYWTISERNLQLVPLEGVLLWNRLLWLGIGAVIVALCFWRFSFAEAAVARRGRRSKVVADPADNESADSDAAGAGGPVRRHAAAAGGRLAPAAAPHLARVPRDHEEHLLRRARARRAAVPRLRQHHRRRPLRHQHLAGDLPDARPALRQLRRVHADHHRLLCRRAGLARARQPLDQISDALPTPTWLPLVSKLGALMLVPAVLQLVLMLCGMAIQASKGYTRFEPGPLPVRPLHHRPGELLAGLRPGDRGARDRRQQVRRPLRHGRVLRAAAVRRPARPRAQPLQVRQRAGGRLFRHERLRPLPAPGARLPGLLGRGLGAAAGAGAAVLEPRHGELVARAAGAAKERLGGPTLGVGGGALLAFVGLGGWIF